MTVLPPGTRVKIIDGPGPTLPARGRGSVGTVVGGCDEPGLRRVHLDGTTAWDVFPVTQLVAIATDLDEAPLVVDPAQQWISDNADALAELYPGKRIAVLGSAGVIASGDTLEQVLAEVAAMQLSPEDAERLLIDSVMESVPLLWTTKEGARLPLQDMSLVALEDAREDILNRRAGMYQPYWIVDAWRNAWLSLLDAEIARRATEVRP